MSCKLIGRQGTTICHQNNWKVGLYTTIQKFRIDKYILFYKKEINISILQGGVKLIKSQSKYIFIVTNLQESFISNKCFRTK